MKYFAIIVSALLICFAVDFFGIVDIPYIDAPSFIGETTDSHKEETHKSVKDAMK